MDKQDLREWEVGKIQDIVRSFHQVPYRKMCEEIYDQILSIKQEKAPVLSEKDLYERYDKPPESDFDICDDCPVALMAMEAQRDFDHSYYGRE
jgi:hypothetical protein